MSMNWHMSLPFKPSHLSKLFIIPPTWIRSRLDYFRASLSWQHHNMVPSTHRLSCKCHRHVADMSATCDTVAGFHQHGAVTVTQNQLTVPTPYVGISMCVGRYTFSNDIFAKCVVDISGVNLPLPADTQPTFAAKPIVRLVVASIIDTIYYTLSAEYIPPINITSSIEHVNRQVGCRVHYRYYILYPLC